ncbi:peptidoglycan-binding domain-containing protein [Kineosporia sp. NBRC 101731]|uniref:peptidoglycan-binding domain-containing protein n=1 Tax=Kineosporia sp. NBRC 101731 TaxID=3032199 RepID=UPI00249FDE3D|nr:peptidoglycan-binding domain-containing protein [Kineosporia sp. NBRC 101731]GLY32141.1 hypothetical protein Kisp02_55060 [Kineosporia sp. NBRC 101731]
MTGPTPTKPGRGAWTATGGLLPPKPGQVGRGYYYRPPYEGEDVVGVAGLRPTCTYNEAVVTEAVRAIQRLLIDYAQLHELDVPRIQVTGRFGDQTGLIAARVQKHLGLVPDCIVGPKTVWALIAPMIEQAAAKYGLPVWLLRGIHLVESQGDLGAVGAETPADTGPFQCNRAAHLQVSIRQAVDPRWSALWTAAALRKFCDQWVGRTSVDLVTLAIASHNSPKSAVEWARGNKPPRSPGRSFNIEDYVEKVRVAGLVSS